MLSFFFLMIRRPPRSTLFPTRRSSDLLAGFQGERADHGRRGLGPRPEPLLDLRQKPVRFILRRRSRSRSEEHTSELQSHLNLVCRLLLEKKNTHAGHASSMHIVTLTDT